LAQGRAAPGDALEPALGDDGGSPFAAARRHAGDRAAASSEAAAPTVVRVHIGRITVQAPAPSAPAQAPAPSPFVSLADYLKQREERWS
jgi:hypothetical protein